VSDRTSGRRQLDITVSPLTQFEIPIKRVVRKTVVISRCNGGESRTRYLNGRPEATKSLYRVRTARLVNEKAVYERLVDDPTRLAIL
jgi:hypothetical protein